MKRSHDLSIAYDMSRKNRKKKASGGSVQSGSPDMNYAKGGSIPVDLKGEAAKGRNPFSMVTHIDGKPIKPKSKEEIARKEHWEKHGYAEGGSVSAANEHRPMPSNMYDDKKMAMQNSHMKPAHKDSVLDKPTERQATMNNSRKVTKIKHPRMVPSNAFSVRMRDEEDDMQRSMSPGPYGEQPSRHDDEDGPDRQGPSTPALKMKMMARGGDVDEAPSEKGVRVQPHGAGGKSLSGYEVERARENPEHAKTHYSNAKHLSRENLSDLRKINPKLKGLAEGGMMPKDHSIEEDERMDEADLMDHEAPSHDEGAMDAHSMNEEGPDRRGPEDEEMMEHHDSIASAIMAKKDREASKMSDSDMDEMLRLYSGGEIKSHDSIYSDDSDQADLSRNADEDANEEDQLSFNALRKENYSESEGLDQLDNPEDSGQYGDNEEMDRHDKHDMVESILRKMKSRRTP